MFNGNFGSFATPSRVLVRPDARLAQAFLTQAFFWMFLGLLLTTGVGVAVSSLPERQLVDISGLFIPLVIGQLVLSLVLQLAIRRISATVGLLLYFVYAASWGVVFGLLLYVYSLGSILTAGSAATAVFGGAAVYGAVTKRDLTSITGYLVMGTVGLFVATLVQWFVGWSWLSYAISIVGVVVFTVLTAWDVQKIQSGQLAAWTGTMEKGAVIGAFWIYLDFVMLFFYLLRLFGGNGRR